MNNSEILKLPAGTKVRIINNGSCHQAYRDGGTLCFSNWVDKDEDMYNFGIRIKDFGDKSSGVCYNFPAEQYEVILSDLDKVLEYVNNKINKQNQILEDAYKVGMVFPSAEDLEYRTRFIASHTMIQDAYKDVSEFIQKELAE